MAKEKETKKETKKSNRISREIVLNTEKETFHCVLTRNDEKIFTFNNISYKASYRKLLAYGISQIISDFLTSNKEKVKTDGIEKVLLILTDKITSNDWAVKRESKKKYTFLLLEQVEEFYTNLGVEVTLHNIQAGIERGVIAPSVFDEFNKK